GVLTAHPGPLPVEGRGGPKAAVAIALSLLSLLQRASNAYSRRTALFAIRYPLSAFRFSLSRLACRDDQRDHRGGGARHPDGPEHRQIVFGSGGRAGRCAHLETIR